MRNGGAMRPRACCPERARAVVLSPGQRRRILRDAAAHSCGAWRGIAAARMLPGRSAGRCAFAGTAPHTAGCSGSFARRMVGHCGRAPVARNGRGPLCFRRDSAAYCGMQRLIRAAHGRALQPRAVPAFAERVAAAQCRSTASCAHQRARHVTRHCIRTSCPSPSNPLIHRTPQFSTSHPLLRKSAPGAAARQPRRASYRICT